jgi:hypothetical protein
MNVIDTQKIAELVNSMHLPAGLGDEQNACSIAAINLALSGKLTDEIPDCMSEVIGRWIIATQDAMPDEMRNSAEWKRLLPLAAGTGRAHEKERLDVLLDHLWTVALPPVQSIADEKGFGAAWRNMLTKKNRPAATAAAAWAEAAAREATAAAAEAATWAAAAEAAEAAAAAEAAEAGAAAVAAAVAATWAAVAGAAEAVAAAEAAEAEAAREATAAVATWKTLNPCGLLERLIAAGEKTAWAVPPG